MILTQQLSANFNHYTGDSTTGLRVSYRFEGTMFPSMVGRLVYEAFVLPVTKEKIKGKFVYPLDGNRLNCRADNLGLATKSEQKIKSLKKARYLPPAFLLDPDERRKHIVKLNRSKRRVVKKYTLTGKLEAVYPSITVAAKKNKVSIGCLGLCLQKKFKVLKGNAYRYENDTYNGKLANWQGTTKKIVQYTPGGRRLKTFLSLKEAERQTGIESTSISSCARKKTRHAEGFVWRFETDSYKGEYIALIIKRKICQYSMTGQKLAVFESSSAAAKNTGGNYELIRRAAKKEIKSSNGFIWRFEGDPFWL